MTNAELTEQEKRFLECYRQLREIYPNEVLTLFCPKTYKGFNLENGKKIIIKQEEIEDD